SADVLPARAVETGHTATVRGRPDLRIRPRPGEESGDRSGGEPGSGAIVDGPSPGGVAGQAAPGAHPEDRPVSLSRRQQAGDPRVRQIVAAIAHPTAAGKAGEAFLRSRPDDRLPDLLRGEQTEDPVAGQIRA